MVTGNLGSSEYAEDCIFTVAVDDVPTSETSYQVEMPHREKSRLGSTEAEDGRLTTTLGLGFSSGSCWARGSGRHLRGVVVSLRRVLGLARAGETHSLRVGCVLRLAAARTTG